MKFVEFLLEIILQHDGVDNLDNDLMIVNRDGASCC